MRIYSLNSVTAGSSAGVTPFVASCTQLLLFTTSVQLSPFKTALLRDFVAGGD